MKNNMNRMAPAPTLATAMNAIMPNTGARHLPKSGRVKPVITASVFEVRVRQHDDQRNLDSVETL